MYSSITFVVLASLVNVVSCTTNVDTAYARWSGGIVPYYIDPRFTATEISNIQAAMSYLTSAVVVIRFTPVSYTDPRFKIFITPYTDPVPTANPPFNSVQAQYCSAYPGMYLAMQNIQGSQPVVLTRGSAGCSSSTRSIMKYLAITLGKRNEHQRGDRDNYITVNPANLTPNGNNTYRKYSNLEAYWGLYPYDYCSITHNAVTEYALPGTQAFIVRNAPYYIPALNSISRTDCNLLVLMYQGFTSACQQFPPCEIFTTTSTAQTTKSTLMP